MGKTLGDSRRDAEYIRLVCAQWQGLLRNVAEWFDEAGGLTLGRHLVRNAEEHLGADRVQKHGEPAPGTGFYFCTACVGRQDKASPLERISAEEDQVTEYRPIFQRRGMIGPACKRDSRRAIWVCHTAVPALADALGFDDIPEAHVPGDYLPDLVSAIVETADGDPAAPESGRDIVLPHVGVDYVIHLRCPGCNHKLWTSWSRQGETTKCPACGGEVQVQGPPSAEFHLQAQCPACKYRPRLRPRDIGKAMACSHCSRPLYLTKHHIAATDVGA